MLTHSNLFLRRLSCVGSDLKFFLQVDTTRLRCYLMSLYCFDNFLFNHRFATTLQNNGLLPFYKRKKYWTNLQTWQKDIPLYLMKWLLLLSIIVTSLFCTTRRKWIFGAFSHCYGKFGRNWCVWTHGDLLVGWSKQYSLK